MPKIVEVTDHDYDRLMMRAGSLGKIKFIIKALLDLSDQAASDIRKLETWRKAVQESGGKG